MLKRIKVKKFHYENRLGFVVTSASVSLVNENDFDIDPDNFDPAKHEFTLNIKEIDRLSRIIAMDFLEQNYRALRFYERALTAKEIQEIIVFLDLKASQFATYTGCGKSKMSKILSGEQLISRPQQGLAIEGFMREFARKGAAKCALGLTDRSPDPAAESDLNVVERINCSRSDAA
jgi:hypothetical protein